MMWFVGLRGAIAFALALEIPSDGGHMILTTTLMLCVFTVVVFGSSTGLMMRFLDIDMHLDPRLASDEDDGRSDSRWLALDRTYFKPFFTRLKATTSVQKKTDLTPDDFESIYFASSDEETPVYVANPGVELVEMK